MRVSRVAPLILASASPRRASLLRGAGIPFVAVESRARERVRPPRGPGGPRLLAMANAEAKAAAVARAHPGRWVLGADTVVVLDHHLFGKPRDAADAVRMLGRLQGRTHRVITAVCLVRSPDRGRRFAVTSRVTFRAMDAEGIRGYLRRVHTLDKAGAYAAQEHAGLIIRRVTGSWSNVVGLPMERLGRELRAVGFPARAPRAKRLAFSPPPP